MTSILLADHHRLSRAGLVKVLESIKGLTIVGEVAMVDTAIDFTVAHTSYTLLLDMTLPRVSGLEILQRIRSQHLGTRVLALTHWTQ